MKRIVLVTTVAAAGLGASVAFADSQSPQAERSPSAAREAALLQAVRGELSETDIVVSRVTAKAVIDGTEIVRLDGPKHVCITMSPAGGTDGRSGGLGCSPAVAEDSPPESWMAGPAARRSGGQKMVVATPLTTQDVAGLTDPGLKLYLGNGLAVLRSDGAGASPGKGQAAVRWHVGGRTVDSAIPGKREIDAMVAKLKASEGSPLLPTP